MSIQAKLQEDLKAAMKAKDVVTRDTIRMLKSDLEKAELTKGSELSDGEEIDVIARAAKTRKESAAQYEEGGRKDLVDKELAEVAVVERYLPKALSEDEARTIIEALAKELGVTEKKQMGSLIKEAMARNRGQLDGKMASKIAASVLS
ncbi:MAG: GatB/YqeY domain-containing protein [Polyangiales bacterium]